MVAGGEEPGNVRVAVDAMAGTSERLLGVAGALDGVFADFARHSYDLAVVSPGITTSAFAWAGEAFVQLANAAGRRTGWVQARLSDYLSRQQDLESDAGRSLPT